MSTQKNYNEGGSRMVTKEELKQLKDLLKVMKKDKVSELSNGSFQVKLSPIAFVERGLPDITPDKKNELEEDLYFSATNFRKKA